MTLTMWHYFKSHYLPMTLSVKTVKFATPAMSSHLFSLMGISILQDETEFFEVTWVYYNGDFITYEDKPISEISDLLAYLT